MMKKLIFIGGTLGFCSLASAALYEGNLVANPGFSKGASEDYSGWTVQEPWRTNHVHKNLVFAFTLPDDGSQYKGYRSASSQGLDLRSLKALQNDSSHDLSTTQLRGLDFGSVSIKVPEWTHGEIGDKLKAKLFAMVDVKTSAGQFRMQSNEIELNRKAIVEDGTLASGAHPLKLNWWADYGHFKGDPFKGGQGIALDQIQSITFNWMIKTDHENAFSENHPKKKTQGAFWLQVDDAELVYQVRTPKNNLEISNLFADNMVLQRNTPIPVFGTADVGSKVSVKLSSGEAAIALTCSSAQAAKKHVNFVVIMADDLGFADVGYHGSKQVPTPHIDSIAKRGVQFTQGYSNGYVCSPTRAALLTGRYQNRFGCEFHIAPYKASEESTIGLPLDELTIAERLKPLGYATGMFGKWHLGGELEENQNLMPASRGFDEFFGILEGASLYFDKTNRERKYRRGHAVIDGEPEYLTDAIGRESVSFIQRHKDQPFLLYVPFTAPHAPMEAKREHMEKFAHIQPKIRRQCVSMIHSMDENIGRILKALKDAGIEENTFVVFLSDNGGKPTNNASINDPFRGAKGQFFEGGIRVPFCLQFPSTLGSGLTIDTPVMSFDIFPTIYKLAGGT